MRFPELHRTNVLQTYCNDHFEFQLPFLVWNQINMKCIYCARVDACTLAKKGLFLFLYKHVESVKGHVLWYIQSIGELARKCYY